MSIQTVFLYENLNLIEPCARWRIDQWQNITKETIEDARKVYKQSANKTKLPITLVALSGETPLGMITLKERIINSEPTFSPAIHALYIDPSHRHKKVGTYLVSALEKLAIELGYSKIYVGTFDAENFYHACGWTTFSSRLSEYGKTEILLHKEL